MVFFDGDVPNIGLYLESPLSDNTMIIGSSLVQHFVKEAAGEDIRCVVIDGKVVASIKRSSSGGDFRSNLHQGGTAKAVRITPAERTTAVTAAKVMGLNVAGVDLLRSNHGPVVMEVNSSPGLEGIEAATDKDIADLTIAFLEQKVALHKSKRKLNTKGTG